MASVLSASSTISWARFLRNMPSSVSVIFLLPLVKSFLPSSSSSSRSCLDRLKKYDYLKLPYHHRWGLILRKDDPLAAHEAVTPEMLMNVPILRSDD